MATHFSIEIVDESLLKVHAMPTCSFEIDIVTMLGDSQMTLTFTHGILDSCMELHLD
jgi:hypothetical protein